MPHSLACFPTLPPYPLQIDHEGQNKEQLYDLLSVNRARIDSIEKQARWERVRGPAELQVGPSCACWKTGRWRGQRQCALCSAMRPLPPRC